MAFSLAHFWGGIHSWNYGEWGALYIVCVLRVCRVLKAMRGALTFFPPLYPPLPTLHNSQVCCQCCGAGA